MLLLLLINIFFSTFQTTFRTFWSRSCWWTRPATRSTWTKQFSWTCAPPSSPTLRWSETSASTSRERPSKDPNGSSSHPLRIRWDLRWIIWRTCSTFRQAAENKTCSNFCRLSFWRTIWRNRVFAAFIYLVETNLTNIKVHFRLERRKWKIQSNKFEMIQY